MSKNKHSGHAKKHNQQGPPKHLNPKDETKETQEEKDNTGTQPGDRNDTQPWPRELIINIPEHKDNRWTTGNIIALIACIAAVAYFISTVFILRATNKQVVIAD